MWRPVEACNSVRVLLPIAMLLTLAAAGCQTTEKSSSIPIVKASGRPGSTQGQVFLKVFVDDDAKAKAPVDVQVAIDEKPLINRSFSMGRDNDDGQYQITLPKGRHTLTATSKRGNTQIRKRFQVKDRQFIELYVTDKGRIRLTPASKLRILRFVIKHHKQPQTKTFNPAAWMRLSLAGSDGDFNRSSSDTLSLYAGGDHRPSPRGFNGHTSEANG